MIVHLLTSRFQFSMYIIKWPSLLRSPPTFAICLKTLQLTLKFYRFYDGTLSIDFALPDNVINAVNYCAYNWNTHFFAFNIQLNDGKKIRTHTNCIWMSDLSDIDRSLLISFRQYTVRLQAAILQWNYFRLAFICHSFLFLTQ